MRRLCLALSLAVASALVPRAAEPCSLCQSGDPAFAFMGSQLFVPRTWHLGLSADRYAKDQVAEDDPGTREKEIENRVTLSASRTFGDRLTLVARLPFAQRTITTSSEEQTLSGLSDPELTAHYRLSAFGPGTWLSASLGLATVPLGGYFEQEIARAFALPATDLILYLGACGRALRGPAQPVAEGSEVTHGPGRLHQPRSCP